MLVSGLQNHLIFIFKCMIFFKVFHLSQVSSRSKQVLNQLRQDQSQINQGRSKSILRSVAKVQVSLISTQSSLKSYNMEFKLAIPCPLSPCSTMLCCDLFSALLFENGTKCTNQAEIIAFSSFYFVKLHSKSKQSLDSLFLCMSLQFLRYP